MMLVFGGVRGDIEDGNGVCSSWSCLSDECGEYGLGLKWAMSDVMSADDDFRTALMEGMSTA
jgi:hypothetical protein